MKEANLKEKRSSLRVSAKFPIRYQIRRGGFYASALTDDLSITGTKLSADRFFPSGVNLNLQLNILSRIVNPIGKVVWSIPLTHSNGYKMGIEFIEINPQDKNYLFDYLNLHTDQIKVMER